MTTVSTDNTTITTLELHEAFDRALQSRDEDEQSRSGSEYWAGETWEAAAEKMRVGDPVAAVQLRAKLEVMKQFRQRPRATARWGEAGSTVDVARFMAGEPENMIETMPARRPSPVVRIAIERAVSASTSTEDIRATGASVLAAVELLRTAGVPSEVWVTFSQRSHLRTYSLQICIQKAGRPIDMDRLAFWTINPAALRRIAFAIEETEADALKQQMRFTPNGSYSTPATVPNKHDFDELAPARADQVTGWLTDLLGRRAQITVKEDD